jgi:hypothetical protein
MKLFGKLIGVITGKKDEAPGQTPDESGFKTAESLPASGDYKFGETSTPEASPVEGIQSTPGSSASITPTSGTETMTPGQAPDDATGMEGAAQPRNEAPQQVPPPPTSTPEKVG